HLRQNSLLSENALLSFLHDIDIRAWGVVTGDPSDFLQRGWLFKDDTDHEGEPLFHPFRLYTIHKILELCELKLTPSATLQRDALESSLKTMSSFLPSLDTLEEVAKKTEQVVNLAILLEPLYWINIANKVSYSSWITHDEFDSLLEDYRQKLHSQLQTLDIAEWQATHEGLRRDASSLDDNSELYLLLRLSKWDSRKKLKGKLACALWIRHIAEVIRRAFEEVHKVKWFEEDQSHGFWPKDARIRRYGLERPLDDPAKARPYFPWNFGLFTGSVVRWYVEGETEYSAISEILNEPSMFGIELVNLYGNIQSGKNNVAFRLQESLIQDRTLRRFSMISLDGDVRENIKAIRQQVDKSNIVGYIAVHSPDFEFANFSLNELLEIVIGIDERQGYSGGMIRNADWSEIKNAADFEQKYISISERKPRGLKGEEWGKELARYAIKFPNRKDDGKERQFWKELRAALQARTANYDLHQSIVGYDRETFEQIERSS
ncbi:MAG: hypothetical protein ACRCYY_20380, partial [Trueperaceae bacterium]